MMQQTVASATEGTLWLPIPAFVVSVVLTLMSIAIAGEDHEAYEYEEAFLGMCFFVALPLALAIASVAVQERGKGLAIASISLCAVSIAFLFIGFL